MGSEDKVKSSLDRIYNWKLVSNRKNVLKGITSEVRDGETILDVLDGFYSREDGEREGKEEQGVLCVSDRKLFFAPGEKPRAGTDIIPFGDIMKIDYIRGYSSVKIVITLSGRTVSFKSFVTESFARKFIGLIENRTGNDVVNSRDDSGKILQGITDLFINRVSIPGFIDRISGESAGERGDAGGGVGKKDLPPEEVINLNYLFAEARKVHQGLKPLVDAGLGSDFRTKLANDLIVLSSLCSMADGRLSDDEILFMSMVMLPLDPGGTPGAAEKGAKLFGFDLFPGVPGVPHGILERACRAHKEGRHRHGEARPAVTPSCPGARSDKRNIPCAGCREGSAPLCRESHEGRR